MNIPKNMTKDEVITIMNKVIDKTAAKYTFYGYTVDDIKQESFIICIEALNRYDGVRPLENFLSVNLSNRLKTFMRDNYFIGSSNEDRKKLAQPAQLDYEESLIDIAEKYSTSYTKIDTKNMIMAIDQYIPASIRMDYLKMINDIYVSKQRKEEVIFIIKKILEEQGYSQEEDDE